jgi:hypothetical protein
MGGTSEPRELGQASVARLPSGHPACVHTGESMACCRSEAEGSHGQRGAEAAARPGGATMGGTVILDVTP